MQYKLLFFCTNPQQNESLWRPIDAAVKRDLAEYREGLLAEQFRLSLTAAPLTGGETVEARETKLPKINVADWMALYILEPVYHTNLTRCLPGASLLFVSAGQDQIALDYQVKLVPCIEIVSGKIGRWFPRLSPLADLSPDLLAIQELDDRWRPWQPKE